MGLFGAALLLIAAYSLLLFVLFRWRTAIIAGISAAVAIGYLFGCLMMDAKPHRQRAAATHKVEMRYADR